MTSSVILGLWDSLNYQRFTIDNISLESKVECLKSEAAKKFNNNKQPFELVYCGLILQDDNSLSFYGVKSGSTIQIVKRPPQEETPPKKQMTDAEVQRLVLQFKAYTVFSRHKNVLQRFKPELLEAQIPALVKDPVAMALIQDPELLSQLADLETFRQVTQKHPSLIEAVTYIVAHIHDDQPTSDQSQASTSTGYSYSLEALSDDDEMETNREPQPHPLARNASYNAITAAQLAAAIANATNTSFNMNSAGMPTTPTTNTNNLITTEMFSNAIQQALGGGAPAPAPALPSRGGETIESITRSLQPQLQQMHEMGLTNDMINIRALRATNGDVETAIELVFNGAVD